MFYSHEILTSHKHGVATVWLVATLGSKSSLKKITRKAILNVDVPKACETIVDSAAPMALRLQGNLLYGVARVYSQQCGYVLSDLQSMETLIRGWEVVHKDMEIDLDAGRARSDQLNLQDDPGFLPDFDLDIDISLFNISTNDSSASRSLSPFVKASSRSNQPPNVEEDEEPQLFFPSMDTPSVGGLGGFDLGGGDLLSGFKTVSSQHQAPIFEDSAINENLEFDFDIDGNICQLPLSEQEERQTVVPSAAEFIDRLESDSEVSARVRAEHEGHRKFDRIDQNVYPDDGVEPFGEDEQDLLPARTLSPTATKAGSENSQARPLSSTHPDDESPSVARAPQHWAKPAKPSKPLLVDQRTELTNKELSEWNTNYLTNMVAAAREKKSRKAAVRAKHDAKFWVEGQGIGGIQSVFGQDRVPHPLSLFSGQALLDLLIGRESSRTASKRGRKSGSEEEDEEEEARRVRARTGEQQTARDENNRVMGFGDEDDMMAQGDDLPPSEVGRYAPPSLPDHSSQMPWNLSLSRQGSGRAIWTRLPGGIGSSVGSHARGFDFPSSLAGRASRLTSASPLAGKGLHLPRLSRISSVEPVSQPPLPSGGDNFDDGVIHAAESFAESEEFQLYGPAAAVDTQTAAQSQWLTQTLEDEAHNFLLFLANEMQRRQGDQGCDKPDEDDALTITLQELLPPTANNYVVAAQAMLHVLSLATKGLIGVVQEAAFDDIKITIVGGVAEIETEG